MARDTQVVIVGGGPAGLALAVELGGRGVDCVLIEPDPRTRLVPRAKLTNVRSMEHLRRWGIADEVRAASTLPGEYSTEIAFVTGLEGWELTRFHNVFFTNPGRDERFAEPAQQIPQYQLEPVLRRRAQSFPTLTFLDGWRLSGLRQEQGRVLAEAQLPNEGSKQVISADYLVGCDGAHSTVRDLVGIPVMGRRAMARNFGVVFRAPALRTRVPFRPALHYWIVNPDCPSFMGPLDTDALWWLQATALPLEVDFRTVDATALVRSSIAVDVEVEVVTTDPWEAHALMASRLREGRVFLAGDAAHVHTPMGAHGMNMGIGDAVDLGWKLAAVLDGWAHPDLLDTYAIERTPLHERVLVEATRNYANLPNHFLQEGLDAGDGDGQRIRREVAARIREAKLREFSSLGLVLGSTYQRSPVVVPDGMPPVPEQVVEFTVAARPGRRIPHAWLDDGRSLFDRVGIGYTLLCFGASTEAARLARAAATRRLPMAVEHVEEPRVASLFGSRLALVRPDQILAWHGDELPADPDALLDIITARRPAPVRGEGDG